ncbi:MAG: hypothetical protein ACTSYJ_07285 [Candidatus Thorarchaeota archaeon]
MDLMDYRRQIVDDASKGYAWRNEDPARTARWKNFFEGSDGRMLENDPVLATAGVSKSELKYRRWFTECLMDNTFREAQLSRRNMNESTLKGDVDAFTKWSLQLVRKIWPRMFAHEIGVGMYPMNQPTGKLRTLDFLYNSSGESYASGTSIYPNEDPDYSDDNGEATEPNKLKMTITSSDIATSAKKLLADWSIEAEQDFMAYDKISLEPEMMKILGMQIERERNREVINGISAAASSNTAWDSTQPVSPNPWANATPRQYAESIWDAICDANGEIYANIYEDANVILAGKTFAGRLEKLNDFKLAAKDGSGEVMTGPNLYGTLAGRYKVYKDPFYTADKAIVIHKSNLWMFVGYAVCTYVPFWISPKIAETDFTFAKGVMTRYAKVAKNGDMFATVTVS